jgi:hypothetical protein
MICNQPLSEHEQKGAAAMAGKHNLEAEEGSAALAIGINPFDYRGGVMAPSGDQTGRMVWALNNLDTLQREADERGLTSDEWSRGRWKMLDEKLGPFWNSNAVAKAFREAEANFRLSGLDPLEIEHYRKIKASLITHEVDFDEAIRLAVEHYTVLDNNPAPFLSPDADNPYCYPGTDVLRNKLGIRDKHRLQIAETVIGTLRNAQLNLFGLVEDE